MTESGISKHTGAVIIGRNEGNRLVQCLASLSATTQIVYVDSGSTDQSVSAATQAGANVVSLDMNSPFTAARARNAGFQRLLELYPELTYVQFVDGDCEVDAKWIEQATTFLDDNPRVAVACGRRRERYPSNSVYNMLCDIEWNTPIGETSACGGDALMRVDAFRAIQGFRPDLIAGEEPELCVRLRATGWKIWRLDLEMTLHDAAMIHFSQWWKRSIRGGYAFTEGSALHGASPERHWVRESSRIRLWGILLPLSILLLATAVHPLGLSLFMIYPLQITRIAIQKRKSVPANWTYAFYLVLGKFPEAIGQLKYLYNRLSGRTGSLIEYK